MSAICATIAFVTRQPFFRAGGLPNTLPGLCRARAERSEAEHREDARPSMIGVVGLVLFALGTLLQLATVLMG